jgi:copper(I)-binding protein
MVRRLVELGDRRLVLRAGLAVGASLLLPGARACEFMTSTLRVTHPWTRATAPDATSAMLGMKFDEVLEADRLVLVETPVASGAEMAGLAAAPQVDFQIPPGQETRLEESGTWVRLLGLKFPLQMGHSYPLRLGFEKGGVYNTTLSVDYTRFK